MSACGQAGGALWPDLIHCYVPLDRVLSPAKRWADSVVWTRTGRVTWHGDPGLLSHWSVCWVLWLGCCAEQTEGEKRAGWNVQPYTSDLFTLCTLTIALFAHFKKPLVNFKMTVTDAYSHPHRIADGSRVFYFAFYPVALAISRIWTSAITLQAFQIQISLCVRVRVRVGQRKQFVLRR